MKTHEGQTDVVPTQASAPDIVLASLLNGCKNRHGRNVAEILSTMGIATLADFKGRCPRAAHYHSIVDSEFDYQALQALAVELELALHGTDDTYGHSLRVVSGATSKVPELRRLDEGNKLHHRSPVQKAEPTIRLDEATIEEVFGEVIARKLENGQGIVKLVDLMQFGWHTIADYLEASEFRIVCQKMHVCDMPFRDCPAAGPLSEMKTHYSKTAQTYRRWLNDPDLAKYYGNRKDILLPSEVLSRRFKRSELLLNVSNSEATSRGEDILKRLAEMGVLSSARDARLVDLALDDLVPNPDQPRQYFDNESLAALGESLKVLQIHPILVSPGELVFPDDPTMMGKYVIIDGERRYRAAKITELPTLRAMIVNVSDTSMIHLVSFLANEHREELCEVDEARAFKQLIQIEGSTVAAVAKGINKSVSYVANRLALLKLDPRVQAMMLPVHDKSQRLKSSIATHLANHVSDPDEQYSLACAIIAEGLTGLQATHRIRQAIEDDNAAPASGRVQQPSDDWKLFEAFLVMARRKSELFGDFSRNRWLDILAAKKPKDVSAALESLRSTIEDLEGFAHVIEHYLEDQGKE